MASAATSKKLEDQAASAALHHRGKDPNPNSVLDEDGRLSSAGAAMSLKYAQAQDLPSFPSVGLKLSSAGAAASLADSNKRSFQHWKPAPIPAANQAALLAKDYEMDPLWQPELSAAGSKAALTAHRDASSVEIWKSKGSVHGHSAAGQALKMKSPNAITEREVSPEERRKALLAATGAMSGSRPRSGSLPVRAGNENKSWALKAATTSHHDPPNAGPFASGDPGFEAARVQNLAKSNVNRQLYGSAPPVSLEVEERNRQDTLRASAIAMAQKMYAIQQTSIDQATGLGRTESRAAARDSHQRNLSDASSSLDDSSAARAPRYENLEEAARRLAQERLAKLHDEHAEYRQYYGAESPPQRSRLSMRRLRRASTGGKEEDSDDEENSRRIRTQMSMFQSKLADVDNKKRQADRDALLEAAHRNVEKRMAKMDERVFQETGKASPAQKEAWEKEARERAQRSVEESMQNVGKVHIGGGKYLDQAEVDAIARARLQPTLDEINDSAERQRARDEEIRLEHERQQEQLARDKAREAEANAEVKAAREAEKRDAKAKKEEEKRANKEHAAAEKERIKQEKEEKRKSGGKPGRFTSLRRRKSAAAETDAVTATTAPVTTTSTNTTTSGIRSTDASSAGLPVAAAEGETIHDQVTIPTAATPVIVSPSTEPTTVRTSYEEAAVPARSSTDEVPASPAKRDSKVKTWFRSHMRGTSKSQKEDPDQDMTRATGDSVDLPRESSMREVAMAGRDTTSGTHSPVLAEVRPVSPIRAADVTRASSSSSISSLSSHEETAPREEAAAPEGKQSEASGKNGRKGFKGLLKKMKPGKNEPTADRAPSNESDDDQFQEAKDKFDEEPLEPPATLSNRPASPRASHDRSRFTEEL